MGKIVLGMDVLDFIFRDVARSANLSATSLKLWQFNIGWTQFRNISSLLLIVELTTIVN